MQCASLIAIRNVEKDWEKENIMLMAFDQHLFFGLGQAYYTIKQHFLDEEET